MERNFRPRDDFLGQRHNTDLYLFRLYPEQKWMSCQEDGHEGQIWVSLLKGKSAQQKCPTRGVLKHPQAISLQA